MRLLPILLTFVLLGSAGATEVVSVSSVPVQAIQAAAADSHFVYAINNQKVIKFDRETGQRLAVSTGPAHHLSSGFLFDGRIYCAHSNAPSKPEESQIMVLEPATMTLNVYKDFGESSGSLTWAVFEDEAWWCSFAFYGEDNARTRLVKFDAEWNVQGEWTYPPEVLADLGSGSIAGGVWRDGQIVATGQDRPTLYRLHVPAEGTVLELVDTIPCPFPGQGITNDPVTGGLIGIDRKRGQVIFVEIRE